MSEINDWQTAAVNNNDTPPDGWPENTMQYSEVNDTAREGMAVLARFYQDSNGTLQTTGGPNAYAVTLNSAHTAYFAGMYFAAEFNATLAAGGAAIDVNGIGLAAITDRAGAALDANELVAGGIYELRYDGTQFQLMGSVSGTPTVDSIILTNTNDPDLVDTDVALNVGDINNEHLEQGPTTIQAKLGATNASEIFINPLGADVIIGSQDTAEAGEVQIFYGGYEKVTFTDANSLFLWGGLDGDPSAPDPMLGGLVINSRDEETYGRFGYFTGSSSLLELRNFAYGSDVEIKGTTLGGVEQPLIEMDPDNGISIYYDGTVALLTTSNGIDVLGPLNSSIVCDVVGSGTGNARLRARTAGGGMDMLVTSGGSPSINQLSSAGAAEKNFISMNRDGNVQLYFNDTSTARTVTAANGGLEVNNTETGAGFERVLTESDAGGSGPTLVIKGTDTFRSSTTLADDPDFSFAVVANRRYRVKAVLIVDTFSNSGIQMELNASGGSGGALGGKNVFWAAGADVTLTPDQGQGRFPGSNQAFGVTPDNGDRMIFSLDGVVDGFTSGGDVTLALQWAPLTATAGGTSIEAGSYFEFTDIGST